MAPTALSGPSSARERLERRLVVQKVWERYVKDAIEPQGLRPDVMESWRRSRDVGISPELPAPRHAIGPDELEARREVDIVYRLARPILDDFAAGLADHGLVYVDARGNMLSIDGDDAVVDALREIQFMPGVSWTEASAGTNGPGTALATRRPVEILSAEHFVEAWHGWGCSAAPVILPGEEGPLAIIDVTGRWEVHSRQALHVAKAVASVIRERIVAARAVRAEVVRHAFRADRQSGEALLAVDTLGRVIALNDTANRRGTIALGPMPAALRAALDRGIFSIAAPRSDEVPVELAEGTFAVAAPVRFGDTPVGAILRVVEPAQRHRRPPAAPRAFPSGRVDFEALRGTSTALRAAVELARTAARTALPVVLTGESGTGKELFARAIHAVSPRREGPFVAVNCGAIPEALIEAELFGYQDGAFTGARRGGAPGRFEDAHSGTLLLDEVSALSPQAQAALLRVLQEREVVRVGGGQALAVDVRIVAATNRPLAEEVRAGRFRHDLYYRLNVLPIGVPPLRERDEDIVLLAGVFLAEAAVEVARPGLRLAPDASAALRRHQWPGNVRELRNVMLRAAATAPESVVTARDLAMEGQLDLATEPRASGEAATLRGAKAESERLQLLDALTACDWNVVQAAKRLDVSRMTLYRLMKKHGIERAPRGDGGGAGKP
jgi:transcriptional regulator of acetoin/glycerol metabolism